MRKVGCSAVLLLTATILSIPSEMQSAVGAETIAIRMERGQRYYQSGNYEAALAEFRAATEIDPGYIKAWENMSWTYWRMGEINQAIEILQSLKAVHPDRSRLLNMIAEVCTAKQDYKQALVAYEESLEVRPGQIDVLAARCKILYWAGRHMDAVMHCKELLSFYPGRDEIRQLLAELQMDERIADYQAAIENWQHLIKKRPSELGLQVELARAYYRSELYQKAFEAAQAVSKLDSDNVSALVVSLKAAIQMQEYERARVVIEELIAVDPNNSEIRTSQARIHNGMAQTFYQKGDYKTALKRFLLAKVLEPELPGLLENIGWTYRRLGQIDEAVKIWEQLLDSQPDNVHILNLLGEAYVAKSVYDKALLMYDKSLKINPAQKDTRFAKAKIKRWTGKYYESAEELSQLVVEYPESAPMRYQLALCLVRLEKYDEAIKHFRELTSVRPEEPKYSMGMARALYLVERYQEALSLANNVLAKDPHNMEALDFMAEDAEFLGDFEKACRLLESAVAVDGNDIPRLNRLAVCSAEIDNYPVVERATEKSLKLLATQPEIRVLYADSLRINGSLDKASKQYKLVLACNPNNMPALLGLKECCIARRDYKRALVYIERVLSIDNTSFEFMLDKAKVLAYAGEYEKSVKILEDLLERVTTREVVLILLYHGLTKNRRSDILRLTNFRAQMELLHELGYSAVTTEDLISAWKDESKLPKKTVLITFDDARRDSFECADPILEDLSFKATMFVPVCIIEAKDPFFCDWQQIEHYARTGRWDVQSHGNYAHRDIVISGAGERGAFLTRRQWLDDENRLENDHEYRERIDTDYRESKNILEGRLNIKVNAFAFPIGNFGQRECSCADSVVNNLTSVKRYFALSFIQHRYGFNLVGDNPYLLKRLEVDEIWTEQQLRDHITENDPVRRVKFNLAKICQWAGRSKRALHLYNELLRDNPLNRNILLGKAKACTNYGRFSEARTILGQILELDSTDQAALEQRAKLDQLTTPAVDSFFSYFEDDNDRERSKWGAYVHLPYNDELAIEPFCARAQLKEKNFNSVYEDEFSLSAIYQRDEARYDLSYTYRDFSGADDAHNYSLMAEMPLFFDDVTLTHAYRNIETARAAIQGIRHYENSVSIRQAINGRLTAYGRYRRDDYTDDNWRNSFKLTGLYRIFNQPKFFAGCELVSDDTDFFSPAYYTPDELRMVRAVFRANGQVFGDLKYSLWYAVGHARERGNDDEIVQDGNVSLSLQASDSLELGLLMAFSDTPTYGSEYARFNVKYRF